MTTKIPVELSSTPGIVDNSDATAITIDSSENVGIGVTTPFSQTQITETGWSSGAPYGTVLTVTGNNTNDANWGHLLITDSSTGTGNGGMLRFATGSTSSDISPFAGLDGFTEGANYGGLKFLTRANGGTATERMRISSSGVVNVGTTEGIAKFNVGNGTGNAIIEMASSSATAVYYEHINRSNTSGSVDVGYYARGSGDFKFYTGSYTVRFTINETGGSSGSDEKLKKDIENISYGLETVKSLQPRKFKWKETDNVGIGFIAQEVESLIPEVVADTTDAKGETDEVTKVLNYANLTAVLTKAIQEQQVIIEDLQTQINEVKNGN